MPVAPRDFWTTAEKLVRVGSAEADFRSSISRSYYAVFSLVKRKTAGARFRYTGVGEHTVAIRAVSERWNDLSQDFSSLQDARIEADYSLDVSVSKGRAEHRLKLAGELLAELGRR